MRPTLRSASCIPALNSGKSRVQKSEQRPNIPIEVSRIPKSPQTNIEILPEIRLRSIPSITLQFIIHKSSCFSTL
jgi:hypothetical protein